MEDEAWVNVVGWEGMYHVSNTGRVKSVERTVDHSPNPITVKERIMKTAAGPHGYPAVNLSRDGKRHLFCVHRLVLEAFVGPRPHNYVACHYDGNKLNNNLSNLRWDTRKANRRDMIGQGNYGMKLKEEDVVKIITAYSSGETQSSIAKRFGIHQTNVSKIVIGRIWSHVSHSGGENG